MKKCTNAVTVFSLEAIAKERCILDKITGLALELMDLRLGRECSNEGYQHVGFLCRAIRDLQAEIDLSTAHLMQTKKA
jgi:hypothetical protein